MGRAAMQPKFVPVNLNNSYGEGISPSPSSPSFSTSSSSTSSFGSTLHRARPHGGMVLLTRPSKSSLLAVQAPMFASPGLLHFHKENAKSVWNRQQAPVVFKSDLARNVGNEALAAHSNVSSRLPLMPHTKGCNESMCSSRLTAKSDPTSKQVPLLREEDFPSLCMLPCSQPQIQQGEHFGFEQEGKMLQSCLMSMHSGNSLSTQNHSGLQSKPSQPLQITMLTMKEPLTDLDDDGWVKNRDSSGNSITTCGENWTDDERETLSASTSQPEEMTSYHGVWRGALGLKDQASRWDLATNSKGSISAADCHILPCNTRQARVISAHSSDCNLTNLSYQKSVPESNATQDDNWLSNKLKRLYGSNTDSICSTAEDGCLRGLQSDCYLECNAKPFFNLESIFKLKQNVGRRRKNEEAEGDNFRDLERESFEAELEKVQEMLEQERLLVVEGQESMAKLATMPDEEPIIERELELQFEVDTDNVTEKDLQLQVEIDMDNCREVEAKEGASKEVRPQSAREEERRLILLEDERRKERATKKLLELEERIAKREAERSLANAASHSSDKNAKIQSEFSVTSNDMSEHEHLKFQDGSSVKLTSLSSLQKGPLECSGMLSCRTTGQEVASLLTAGSLHDLDVAEMAPKVLQVIQATEALKSDDILQAHDEDILVEGENFETTKPEKGTLENIKHGACTTTTTTTTTKDVSSGAEQGQELWMGASESYHVDSHLEECDRWMRGGLFVESEGETQQNMTCKTDLNSMISTVIKNGGKLSNQAGECKLDGLSKSCVYDHLKSKVQGTECGGIGIEDLVACLESQELFGQVMPNTNEKKHDKTENSLKSSLYETKVGLAEHKSLPECSFFPLHPNSSQLGSLQQPFSAMSLPPTESASFLASTEDQQKQHVASSMDMCSTAPFMLHAIQIGSIQMPIGDDDLWMPRFSPLHCIQASSLQFGQLCLPSTDQPLLMAGSNLAVVGQTPEHQKVEAEACTCVQQATDLTKNCNKVFWSPSLSSDIEQVIRPADSMETAVIQFGDLSSLVLQKQLSTGKFPLCLSHANKNSPEHQVNAELSPLSNTESNSLKGLDLPVDFAENSVVNCQQPCQNALVAGRVDKYGLAPDFGFKEQNQALLMTHQIDNAQLRLFSAFPDRKKRGNAGTCAGVSDRKYWRACTMKMKYVKVSHFMPERVLPGLEAHNNSIHRSAGKFVYKKKELPEGEKACQANQELVGNLPSDAITILQDHCSEELRACQRKSEISMYNIDAKASMLHLSKQPQFVTSEDSAMPNGVVCVFTQQGIDAPYTVDDFIEVKSRRQMLRKQRKEEDETKSGPKPCKTVAHQQRSSKFLQLQRDQWNHHKNRL